MRLLARGLDLLSEAGEPDRADDDIVADHGARRAVEPQRLGELHALFVRLAHRVPLQVLLHARDVEAWVLGGAERLRLAALAAATEQLLMEVEIFLAGLILH